MKNIVSVIIFLWITIPALSQNRANIWYFGYEAGLDFNGQNPIALTNGKLSTSEGCATICDNNGNLLFYTDGVLVYNKEHSIMQNGIGLEGDSSSTHSAIIVPKPESSNLYYVFTVDDQHGTKSLKYSIVDMSLENGLGAITTKNIMLYEQVPEKVVAYKKSNSDEFWVVSQKYNSNEFIAYDITASGINTNPVISAVGVVNGPVRRLSSQIKISPNGRRLAIANGWEVQVFNFDEVTGKISDPITLLQDVNTYGIEFSPDSSLLYVAYYQGVCQYDLTAGSENEIETTKVILISSSDSFGSLQLGPDNKIYGTRVNGEYLSVINEPNKYGVDCDFIKDGIFLAGRRSYLGLPTFISNIYSLEGEIDYKNTCLGQSTEFSFKEEVDSLVWDFGDPNSGTSNSSTDVSPTHTFSKVGLFNVSVTVTYGNQVERFSTQVNIEASPVISNLPNLISCEDSPGSGFSTSFDISNIEAQILNGQTDKIVTYTDGSGNEYSRLPNPFSNTIENRETIKVRVATNNDSSCFDETTFDLIVKSKPNLSEVKDIFECSTNGNGFSTFNLKEIQENIATENIKVEFYYQDGERIPDSDLEQVTNKVKDLEIITIKAINTVTQCSNETTFKIGITASPIANDLTELTACDDNNDGISNFFDTSNIEQQVLGNQENMAVSYFNEAGDQLPSPLPNPYTNINANEETITVRLTNSISGCYSETSLILRTSSQPSISTPLDLYSCDTGNGIGSFDTSGIEEELIGNQSGLFIYYTDENGNDLPSPLPENYRNKKAWSETINVRVESESSSICYSETSFDLIVNELPDINLKKEYFLCELEPYLNLRTDQKWDSWIWTYQDGTVISESFEAKLSDAGTYTLKISKDMNGVLCENSFSFSLVRSALPSIEEIKIQDFSDNNSITVITSGDGDFEYSIDDINFQETNTFYNLSGGIYTVHVRDKFGCGLDTQEVVLIDYPKIHTPNNDGYNDFWQIDAIVKLPESKTLIYDRYGKFLKELTSGDKGWDGTFNGKQMPTDDYWFTVYLSDGRTFSGHFSLIRK